MKKTFNKLLSLAIVTVLILSFSVIPISATGNDPTQWTLTSEAARPTLQTITANTNSGVLVRAYQIVKGTYKDGKLTGYVKCDGLASIPNIDTFDFVSPTSDWIAKIANYIQEHPTALDSVQMANSETSPSTYTAKVEAGEYIILVKKYYSSMVYNPAVVAVNVTDANLLSGTGGSVDMTTQFVAGDTAYMKSSTTDLAKSIVVKADNNIYSRISSASMGGFVSFIVASTIPSYSNDYGPAEEFKLQYTIIDNLHLDHSVDSPFLGVAGLKVRVGLGTLTAEDEVAEGANTYAVYYYDSNDDIINWDNDNDEIIYNPTAESLTQAVKYEIRFADAFIRANGTNNVEVTYSSILTDNAKLAIQDYSGDFVPNRTEAILRYSNDPTVPNSYMQKSSTTYIYTFGIDAVGDGIQTYELNKVTQAGGTYVSVPDNNNEGTKKSQYALAGATFTLYSDAAMTDVIGTATSDANGHIEFRGLGEGTYYIKEIAAPSGYTLNENNYKIVILPTYEANKLWSYKITTYLMSTTDTQIGSATYKINNFYSPSAIIPTVTPAEVVNTTLATLPSTGGMGTIIITIIAGIGMAVFLTVFIVSKKRKAKKD